MNPTTADVLIIGAGPVGLTTAALLGDLGVSCVVVERADGLSTHPRASGIHGRTMEVFRQLRVADVIRAAGVPDRYAQGFGWYRRLTQGVVAELRFDDGEAEASYPGPEPPCFCPQTDYEPLLLAAATRFRQVRVVFGTEVVGLSQDANGVTVRAVRSGRGPEELRSRFLVAADGAASNVRDWLQLGETGTAVFGHSINVHFRAQFGPAIAAAPYMLFWIEGEAAGTFARADADGSVWTYNFAGEPGRAYRPDDLTSRIRLAAGVSDLDIEVLGTYRWEYDQSVTTHWRGRRVLLAGDAAHRFPPHGAFGMNSGVQDSQNLAWKLGAVIRGFADDALLDTYEAERMPVAEANGRQALANTEGIGPRHDTTSSIEEVVSGQRHHLHSLGQQFGTAYVSAAVIPDGTPAVQQTVSEYTPTARPGSRAPHLWVRDRRGLRVSTVDLSSRGFALLAASSGGQWRAAASFATHHAIPVTFHCMGPAGDLDDGGEWRSLYGVDDDGAVLVRPDGYVAARFAGSSNDDGGRLYDAITQILRPDRFLSGSALRSTSPQTGSKHG